MKDSQYEVFSRLLLLPPSQFQALSTWVQVPAGVEDPRYAVAAAYLILYNTYLHLLQRLIMSAANPNPVALGIDTLHLKESADDHVTQEVSGSLDSTARHLASLLFPPHVSEMQIQIEM
jgi:hypothetical protein